MATESSKESAAPSEAEGAAGAKPGAPSTPARKRARRVAASTAPRGTASASAGPEQVSLSTLRAELAATRKLIERLQPKVSIGKRPLPDVVRDLVPRVEGLAKSVRRHETPLRNLLTGTQRLRTTISKQARVLAQLSLQGRELHQRSAQIEPLRKQLAKFGALTGTIEDLANDARNIARAARDRIEALDTTVQTALAAVAAFDDKASEMSERAAEIDALAAARIRFEDRLAALAAAHDRAVATLDRLQNDVERAAGGRAELQQSIESLSGRLDGFADALKRTTRDREMWNDALEVRLGALREELNRQDEARALHALERERVLDDRLRALESIQTELPERLVDAGLKRWRAEVGDGKGAADAIVAAIGDRLLTQEEIQRAAGAYDERLDKRLKEIDEKKLEFEDLVRRRFDQTSARLDTLSRRYRLWMLALVLLVGAWTGLVAR